ncbi:photosynthetic NDH subunit of subcomplex B 2, chloroplastic [Aegilops tauschii subsp. strangulata]|uniref:Photosynthetic NDH subunit of subcomplex B 2, chloroplastic n=2 Tax=Aegilops tauschii TaxID=37682 RepID=A0A453ITD5_AEGTS|nr:photosynthetic NDH subunit of subcomplex B 2, chloroplastic [Aegilops tauschii subsp. strangulata]
MMAASSFLPLHLPASPRPATVAARAASGVASTVPAATQTSQLEETFGRKGLRFGTDATGAPTAELSVRNGSSLQLRLNDGLVTSYRPKVSWEGGDGCRELLHTVAGAGAVKGGVGLVLNEASSSSSGGASLLGASEWSVADVDSDSYDAVQVELGCSAKGAKLEVSYVVTLYPLSMATAVIVKNNGAKPVELTGAVLSHIKFDKRRGTAVEGLRGCPYCSHPPPASGFALLTPAEAMKREESGWFGGGGEEPRQGAWTVEENLYTILKKKVSRVYAAPPEERKKRIYSTAPSKFTTIDQSSGLGFRLVRMGFEDMYLSSPGGLYEKFGNDYFLCTGPASILVPVVVGPGEEWRGAQVIEHDNL